MASAEFLLHPVRLRVVQALLGDRLLTTADLRRELPEVPVATLYRQVAALVENGVLEVADERKVRGAVERTYRLRPAAASVGASDAAALSPAQHRQAFLTFVAALLADFDRYLERGEPDLGRDLVGYRQVALHLTDAEVADLAADLSRAVGERAGFGPGGGRVRRVLTTILLPVPGAPPDTSAPPDTGAPPDIGRGDGHAGSSPNA
jgi:hypothetical protein